MVFTPSSFHRQRFLTSQCQTSSVSKNYSAPQGSWRNDVKTPDSKNRIISRHDYGPALQGALAWLGDRYLLAEPVNRRSEDRNQAAAVAWKDVLVRGGDSAVRGS
jgi:hypothetical protein